MSQENVDTVREFIAAFNRGEENALVDFCGEDVEIDWSRSPATYRGVYRGRDAALKWFDDIGAVFEAGRIEPIDLLDAGNDVIVPHRVHLRGRDGIVVKVSATYVFKIRGGRCIRWTIYQEHEEAMEELGL